MRVKRYAGIDIGSNAARLIIKDLIPAEDGTFFFKKRNYLRLPLRLGEAVFTTGSVPQTKIKQLVEAMRIYKNILDFNHTLNYAACATSALRNAANRDEIIDAVRRETGIDIRIIDGYEEARLLYLTTRESLKEHPYCISADMGGGSLQLAVFQYEKLIWARAFKTGTLRFLTQTIRQEEISELEKKALELSRKYPDAQLTGSGGNINKIAKIIGKKYIPYQDMQSLYKKMNTMTYEQRIQKYTLRTDRADVIIPALRLYLRIMELTSSSHIFVPKTGLADGIIHSLFTQEYQDSKLLFKF